MLPMRTRPLLASLALLGVIVFSYSAAGVRQVAEAATLSAGSDAPALAGGGALAALDPFTAAAGATEAVLGPLPPGLLVTTEYTHYDVAGSTQQGLRSQLLRHGPRDRDGTWSGATVWDIRWSYPYAWRDPPQAGCRAGQVSVTVGIRFVLPRWQQRDGASPELVAEWERYMAALEAHEDGHMHLVVQAGLEMERALSALQSASSCQAFEQAADATAREVMWRHDQEQIHYDRLTQHGASQGAVFR